MNDWTRFNETLPVNNFFTIFLLNMEDITDADYAHVTSVCKDFEIKFWRIS